MSRSHLKLLTILMFVVFFGVASYIFVSSLGVSEATKNRYVPGILIADIDKQKTWEYEGRHLFIIQKSNIDYVVWNRVPQFSGDMVASCLIISASDDLDRGVNFVDLCSSSFYSEDGEVIKISHPLALPMEKISWSIQGKYLVLSENT